MMHASHCLLRALARTLALVQLTRSYPFLNSINHGQGDEGYEGHEGQEGRRPGSARDEEEGHEGDEGIDVVASARQRAPWAAPDTCTWGVHVEGA